MGTSKYGRKDALLSKLAQASFERDQAQEAFDFAKSRLSRAKTIEDILRQQVEDLDVVKVAYLTTPAGKEITTPLQTREPFDYIDGTAKGLVVGDVVVAPTRYNRYQRGIVVQVGGQRTYFGKLNRITEVLYP